MKLIVRYPYEREYINDEFICGTSTNFTKVKKTIWPK